MRPGTGNSSSGVSCASQFLLVMAVNKELERAIIKSFSGMISMAKASKQLHLPVRSIISLFISNRAKLAEHCKHQSCYCSVYNNMLGIR